MKEATRICGLAFIRRIDPVTAERTEYDISITTRHFSTMSCYVTTGFAMLLRRHGVTIQVFSIAQNKAYLEYACVHESGVGRPCVQLIVLNWDLQFDNFVRNIICT